jgi:TPR repeat protein
MAELQHMPQQDSSSIGRSEVRTNALAMRALNDLTAIKAAEDWYLAGMAYCVAKRYRQAEECFKKGLAVNPLHRLMLVECAALHMDSGQEPPDYPAAVVYFTRAAELGSSTAQLWLGWMYRAGEGVVIDVERALSWLLKAVAQENSDESGHWADGSAQGMLNDLYSENPSLRASQPVMEPDAYPKINLRVDSLTE